MKKITWITASNFLDHSYIINEISKTFDIDWIVDMKSDKSFFSKKDLESQILGTSIKLSLFEFARDA